MLERKRRNKIQTALLIAKLKKIFFASSAQAGCLMAGRLLLEGSTVDEIYAVLRKEGFNDRTAARIVTFLPSAFARVFYQDAGYLFPDHFYNGVDAYNSGKSTNFHCEPIFKEAMRLAQQMRRDGDWSLVAKIVELSAEHRGILQARAEGLTPTGSSAIIYNF